ncbi:protein of unknown function [Candidatus Methylocalor cossyra]|uniref:Uncharacterized protein n=1 Tax=Candidatus Methylocalor cossyra TaxID=3108543 RepID=A0ABM9NHW0_9GAMM
MAFTLVGMMAGAYLPREEGMALFGIPSTAADASLDGWVT